MNLQGPVPLGPHAFLQLSPRVRRVSAIPGLVAPCQQFTLDLDLSANPGVPYLQALPGNLIVVSDGGPVVTGSVTHVLLQLANGPAGQWQIPSSLSVTDPYNQTAGAYTSLPVLGYAVRGPYAAGPCAPGRQAAPGAGSIGYNNPGIFNSPTPVGGPHQAPGWGGGTGGTGPVVGGGLSTAAGMSTKKKVALGVVGLTVVGGAAWYGRKKRWW